MNPIKEGNQYDKIVKENIESIIPALMETVLGFKVVESVVLKEKLQQTKEKEADALRLITDPEGNQFILHLEFQVEDYKKMIYRMLDYWALLKSKYEYSVKQFVIYIGEKHPKMPVKLEVDDNYFQFKLINISEYNYLKFIKSSKPEDIIMAVLSDFGKNTSEIALNHIIHRLEETIDDNRTFQKYITQLRVLSKLRNLDIKLDDMIHNWDKYIDAENDYLYIRGQKAQQEKVVTNLLSQTDFGNEKIANIANVTIEFVENVKEKLFKK